MHKYFNTHINIFHFGILPIEIYHNYIMKRSIYSDDYIFLTKQLKKARLEAGLTQKDVSVILEKTQSYISKIETGELRIDVIQLREIAKLYKKGLNYFFKE